MNNYFINNIDAFRDENVCENSYSRFTCSKKKLSKIERTAFDKNFVMAIAQGPPFMRIRLFFRTKSVEQICMCSLLIENLVENYAVLVFRIWIVDVVGLVVNNLSVVYLFMKSDVMFVSRGVFCEITNCIDNY